MCFCIYMCVKQLQTLIVHLDLHLNIQFIYLTNFKGSNAVYQTQVPVIILNRKPDTVTCLGVTTTPIKFLRVRWGKKTATSNKCPFSLVTVVEAFNFRDFSVFSPNQRSGFQTNISER